MSAPGGGRQQLQELSQELQAVEEQQAEVEANIEQLQTEKSEIDDAIEALDALESGSTVQVPLGGGAYVRAEVQEIDEVVVTLGGGYAAERTEGGAVETLQTKQETLDDRIEELNEELEELEERSQQLEQQAQQAQQQMMQQQMQQQGDPSE
ncbi:MAG: prefoldin subunit alpha [Halobacteriaceae archaeon]